jgi:hypothetical protein
MRAMPCGVQLPWPASRMAVCASRSATSELEGMHWCEKHRVRTEAKASARSYHLERAGC